jgi:putative transcriptional regulator
VSKLEKRLIQAAKEGVAIARGELDPASYRVHPADDDDAAPVHAGLLMRVKPHHRTPGGLRTASKHVKHRVGRKSRKRR